MNSSFASILQATGSMFIESYVNELNFLMKEEIIYGKVGGYTMSSKTINNSKYTEDWITVKNITNGMIELDNKFKVTGVKIRPRNML
mgnify:CR=1 FL=1